MFCVKEERRVGKKGGSCFGFQTGVAALNLRTKSPRNTITRFSSSNQSRGLSYFRSYSDIAPVPLVESQ